MERKTGVMGCGVVGGNTIRMLRELGNYEVVGYDKYKESASLEELNKCDLIFLCLPTPIKRTWEIDLSYIYAGLDELLPDKTVVIRSTIVPTTCDMLQEKYKHLRIVFMPEFLTEETPWEDTLKTSRVIIGARNIQDASELVQIIQACFPYVKIIYMGTAEAEAYKYCCNCLLASQVAVANELSLMLEPLGVSYGDIEPYFKYDKRIGTHTKVNSDYQKKGFGGKCFPKDMMALIRKSNEEGYTAPLMTAIIKFNNDIRIDHDWNDIAGAVSECGYE